MPRRAKGEKEKALFLEKSRMVEWIARLLTDTGYTGSGSVISPSMNAVKSFPLTDERNCWNRLWEEKHRTLEGQLNENRDEVVRRNPNNKSYML